MIAGALAMKIFGVSIMTILLILVTAIVVRKFGNQIPFLNQVPTA